jgi:hypothetical protein
LWTIIRRISWRILCQLCVFIPVIFLSSVNLYMKEELQSIGVQILLMVDITFLYFDGVQTHGARANINFKLSFLSFLFQTTYNSLCILCSANVFHTWIESALVSLQFENVLNKATFFSMCMIIWRCGIGKVWVQYSKLIRAC